MLIVLYDKYDASDYLGLHRENYHVLTLTPDAYHLTVKQCNDVLRSTDYYDNHGHDKTVKMVSIIESSPEFGLLLDGLEEECQREVFRSKMHIFLSMCMRLWFTVPDERSYGYMDGSGINVCNNKADLCLSMINKILFDRGYLDTPVERSPYGEIIRIVNMISAWFIGKRKCVLHSGVYYGMKNLLDEYERYNYSSVCFRYTNGGVRDVVVALVSLVKIVVGRSHVRITVSPLAKPEYGVLGKQRFGVGEGSLSQYISDAYEMYQPVLNRVLAVSAGLYSSLANIIEKIGPRLFVAHEMKSTVNAALANASRDAGVASYLVSHGTHTDCGNRSCLYEQMDMARGILVSGMAACNIMQSDFASDFADEYYAGYPSMKYDPIMWGYGYRENGSSADSNRLTLLHASTFKAFPACRPWIFESSDEYHLGLVSLIEVVSGIEGVRLIIRMRDIPECSVSIFKEIVHSVPNVELSSEASLVRDMGRSDVLVSSVSTTIEEAVVYGKKVLLWGYGARYSHVNHHRIKCQQIDSAVDEVELHNKIVDIRDNKDDMPAARNRNGVEEFVKDTLRGVNYDS